MKNRFLNNYIKSPIVYAGSKFSFLDKLKNFIPTNKKAVLWDAFGGSGTIAFNFAKSFGEIIYNEKDKVIFDIVKFLFSLNTIEKINSFAKWADKLAIRYDIISSRDHRNIPSHLNPKYENWLTFLEKLKIGKDSPPKLLYLASLFSFSYAIKFTKEGKLAKSFKNQPNLPSFSIKKCYALLSVKNIKFFNENYLDLLNLINKNDIVYLDPPYFLGGMEYCRIWKEKNELDLYSFCEKLNAKGIKWIMSNMWICKGQKHSLLMEWSKKNKWNVIKWDQIYSNNLTTNRVVECVVRNFKHYNFPKQSKLF